jgi:hypothetical protein
MANVIRTQFNGFDGRLNIDKGILTLYGKENTKRYNVTVTLDLPVVREFLAKAYQDGKFPSNVLTHSTAKNKFSWNATGLERWDIWNDKMYRLSPYTEHTKEILSAMVRANVK